MKQISIIFPNQLFRESPILKINCEILILEDSLFFGNDKFHKLINHKNKLVFHRASMLAYKNYLEISGFKVLYIENKNNVSTVDYLSEFIKNKYQKINLIDPHDFLIMKRINNFVESNNLALNILPSPMFMSSEDLKDLFASNAKKPLMGRFYENQRKSQKILVNPDDTPEGGKWSFDEMNRKKLPKKINIPDTPKLQKNKFVVNAERSLANFDIEFIGESNNFLYPTNFEEADEWLNDFFKHRFFLFGDYEDAISKENSFLWHSLLSPLLNSGLLTPDVVVNKALLFAKNNNVPINSLEGFIRQIIGWREFIRGIYHYKGKEEQNSNFWKHDRKLTTDWYEGTTGIAPLDDAIKDCIKYGYTHHIPRLMIICNIMNLSKIDPNEIYKWFMEMFVDSSDWVMVPNVYGMGTFADGGIFATKPYSCGSNYILKMSNYKKDEWCDIVDGLYWMFMSDNITFFKSNPRLAILVKSLERMSEDRKKIIFEKANHFIEKKTLI